MDDNQLLRYSRQILLPEVDVEGQEKLLDATVLVMGIGGLGSPVAMYLAAAGVGHLILVDFDTVDLSNLQRQVVHRHDAIGQAKTASAEQSLQALNPDVKLTLVNEKLEGEALQSWVAQADVVVDCTDNFATRFALNQASVENRVPLVSGAAIRLEGQVSVFDPRREESPCYRCLYADIDDNNMSCAQNGVLAPLVGLIGSVQAVEAMKLIAGFGKPLVGRLQVLDASNMSWRELKLARDPACPVCRNR